MQRSTRDSSHFNLYHLSAVTGTPYDQTAHCPLCPLQITGWQWTSLMTYYQCIRRTDHPKDITLMIL